MTRKLTSKGMILDICSMRTRAKGLLNDEAECNIILEYLTNKDYYYDDNLQIPLLKDIVEHLGISYDKARRQLKKLYTKLVTDDDQDDIKFKFSKVEYWIHVKGFYNSRTLVLEELPIIPRKGERVTLPYFKEYLDTEYFYVSDVYYEFEDNKQVVFISLKHGSFNSYWELRKDQAVETGEISPFDYIMETDWELKKQLKIKPGNPW
jgi:hypothetical protein